MNAIAPLPSLSGPKTEYLQVVSVRMEAREEPVRPEVSEAGLEGIINFLITDQYI